MASARGKKARRGLGEAARSRAKFRSSPEWADHRLKVLERSGGHCECCGIKYPSSKLQVHHKDLNKERYEELDDLENFVSLCSICHRSLHAFEKKVRNKKRAFQGEHSLAELIMRFFV